MNKISKAYRRKFLKREVFTSLPTGEGTYLTDVKILGSPKDVYDAMGAATSAMKKGVVSFRELRNYKLNLYYKLVLGNSGILPCTADAVKVVNAMSYSACMLSGKLGTRLADTLSGRLSFKDKDGKVKLVAHTECFKNSPDLDGIIQLCEKVQANCIDGGNLVNEDFIKDCSDLCSKFEDGFGEIKGGTVATPDSIAVSKMAYTGKWLSSLIGGEIAKKIGLKNLFYSVETLSSRYLDFSNFDDIKKFCDVDIKIASANELGKSKVNIDDVFVPIAKQGKIIKGFYTLNPDAYWTVFEADCNFFNEVVMSAETKLVHLNNRWEELKKHLINVYELDALGLIEMNEAEKLLTDIYLGTVSVKTSSVISYNPLNSLSGTFSATSDVKQGVEKARSRLSDILEMAFIAVSARYERIMLNDVMGGCFFEMSTASLREDIYAVHRYVVPETRGRFIAFTADRDKYSSVGAKTNSGLRLVNHAGSSVQPVGLLDPQPSKTDKCSIDSETGAVFYGDIGDIREVAIRTSAEFPVSIDDEVQSVSIGLSAESGVIFSFYTVLPPSKGVSVASFAFSKRRGSGSSLFQIKQKDPTSCSWTDLLFGQVGYVLNTSSTNPELESHYAKRLEMLKQPLKDDDPISTLDPVERVTELNPITEVVKKSGAHFLDEYVDAIKLPNSLANLSAAKKMSIPNGVEVPSECEFSISKIPSYMISPSTIAALEAAPGKKLTSGLYKGKDQFTISLLDDGFCSINGVLFFDSDSPNVLSLNGKSFKDRAQKRRFLCADYSEVGVTLGATSPFVVVEKDLQVVDPSSIFASPLIVTCAKAGLDRVGFAVQLFQAATYALYFYSVKGKNCMQFEVKADGQNIKMFDSTVAREILQVAAEVLSSEVPKNLLTSVLGFSSAVKLEELLGEVYALDDVKFEDPKFTERITEIQKKVDPNLIDFNELGGVLLPLPITQELEYDADGELKCEKFLKFDALLNPPTFLQGIDCVTKSGAVIEDTARVLDGFIAGLIDSFCVNRALKQSSEKPTEKIDM